MDNAKNEAPCERWDSISCHKQMVQEIADLDAQCPYVQVADCKQASVFSTDQPE